MRLLSVRLIVSLIVGITLVSSGFSYYEVLGQKRALRSELERRDETLAEILVRAVERSWTARGAITPELTESRVVAKKNPTKAHGKVAHKVSNEPAKETSVPVPANVANDELQRLVQRFGNRESVMGVVIYDRQGALVAMTPELAKTLNGSPEPLTQAISGNREESSFTKVGGTSVHILALPIRRENEVLGGLAVVHDASYIRAQILLVWRQTFFRVLAQVFLIVLITLLIVRWSITGPIARAANWMRALRTGKVSFRQGVPDLHMFRPLAREVATMAESLKLARSAAENEARLRDTAQSLWTADRLSVQLRTRLQDSHLFVVSNREPYMHQRDGKAISVVVPSSGLVTALEPVLNACDGTWIAHGSGNADLEVVDDHDRIRVPPDHPRYTLRRVWLTKEEEEGYYYGFANEGLWPLCHIAHTRPLFRASDWQHYEEVNRKFRTRCLKRLKA